MVGWPFLDGVGQLGSAQEEKSTSYWIRVFSKTLHQGKHRGMKRKLCLLLLSYIAFLMKYEHRYRSLKSWNRQLQQSISKLRKLCQK